MSMPVTTARLLLRPLVREDLPSIDALGDRPMDDAGRRWLEWTVLGTEQHAVLHQPPYGELAVIEASSGSLVGMVGLVPSLLPLARTGETPFGGRRLPEVGLYWMLAPSARGRGYATEAAAALIDWAFEHLVLERIVATTDHDNVASVRVMERLGMTIHRNHTGEPPWLQVVGVLDHGRA